MSTVRWNHPSVLFAIVIACCGASAPAAPAGGYQVVYRFQGGNDGAEPDGSLIADDTGALYGTTAAGGAGCNVGCGTVFKLSPSAAGYAEAVIYRFRGASDGAYPFGSLVADAGGALYGATREGGDPYCVGGCGAVFKLTPSGSAYVKKVIYTFHWGNGAHPNGSLIADTTGTLYGTTYDGGASGFGTVFELVPSGAKYAGRVLYSFRGGGDGGEPNGGLIADETGVLYGTTAGYYCCAGGTAFKLVPSGTGYTESVLHLFLSGSDGEEPGGGLIEDASGALYGTTYYGGGRPSYAHGTVFKLTPSGSTFVETILHRFGYSSQHKGRNPDGGLTAGRHGELYGTALLGGGGSCSPLGCGVVFELRSGNKGDVERVLHRFEGGSDGANPSANLIVGKNGRLYGTTARGGAGACPVGCGIVYSVSR
jgi:uncharacterized repeat protein (TIGR03803 family)